MKKRQTQLLCVAILCAAGGVLKAGDLNPPPGPIGPTMKTLTEVEPRVPVQSLTGSASALHVINEPGSYYLTDNITGVTGKNGIEIEAVDVTLDLNGFALIGVGGSASGVSYAPGVNNLVVRNGTIRDWGNYGIGPQDNNNPLPIPTNGQFEDIRVSGNGFHGFLVGYNSRIINCGAVNNAADGINVGHGSVVTNCNARNNSGNGFIGTENCVLVNCSAVDNQGSSYSEGFDFGSGSILTGCSARGNSGNGILCVDGGCVIIACTSVSNVLFGIDAPNSLIRGNLIADNSAGSCDVVGATCVDNHGCSCP